MPEIIDALPPPPDTPSVLEEAPEPEVAPEPAAEAAPATRPEDAIEILETVPNVSTADPALVDHLASALSRAPGVRLLHVTSDTRHGRTVFTAVGKPDAVLDALVVLGRRCAEAIDLRKHHGIHPRVGALDVVPLIPLVPPLPPEAAAGLARRLAERLAQEAGLAAVAYAAADPDGRQLPDLRQGGPAGLLARVEKSEVQAWRPEGDTREARAKTGFACVGARGILVAFNVELASGEVGHARRIAQLLRERDGGLPAVRALGFRLSEERTQVSMNLLDYRQTGVVRAFEAVRALAAESKLAVVRSELVGCVPRDAWPAGTAELIFETDMAADTEGRRILETWLPGGALESEPGLLVGAATELPAGDPPADADQQAATAESGPSGQPPPARGLPKDQRIRILDLPIDEARTALVGILTELDERPFRANQVLHGVYGRRGRRFEDMTDLSAALRSRLAEKVRVGLLDLAERAEASDGTVKYLWRLSDGSEIESVAIPSERRTTFCVSSQVGCALRCGFCATGYLGLTRNLTTGEMVDQVLAMLEDGRQDQQSLNVVFMGMGEPGYNLDAVLAACRTLNDPTGLGIGARHVTVSTAGVVPAIERIAREPLQLRLAVSLHVADQERRERLMNVAERFPLPELLEACQAYVRATRRQVTFEVVVIPGVNDSPELAEALAAFASQVPSKVNLIPYNPVSDFGGPAGSEESVADFRAHLQRSYAGEVMVRQTRGRDVEAACGMLHRARHAAQRTGPVPVQQLLPTHPGGHAHA